MRKKGIPFAISMKTTAIFKLLSDKYTNTEFVFVIFETSLSSVNQANKPRAGRGNQLRLRFSGSIHYCNLYLGLVGS